MRITVGVITHEPYINNYCNLISTLDKQRDNNPEIEIITLVQLSEKKYAEYKDYLCAETMKVKEFMIDKTMIPSQARNFILEKGTGEWIAYIDGDCTIGDNYLEALWNATENASDEVGAIQGAIYASYLSRYGKYEYFYDVISLFEMGLEGSSLFFASNKTNANQNVRKAYEFKQYQYIRKVQGFNFAVRRNVVEQIGEFNEDIETAEDREYSARIIDNGYFIGFSLMMEVYHDYNMTLKRILRRKKWHAYGCAYMILNYNMIYKVDLKNRLLYILDLFLVCKKGDFLLYKFTCEFIFLRTLRNSMKEKYYGRKKIG